METFPEVLHGLMAARGTGVLATARAVPCDPAYISRLANGRQAPSAQIARALDRVLSGGGRLSALAGQQDRPADPDGVRETSASLIMMERRMGGDVVLPAAVQSFRAARQCAGDDHDRLAAAAEAGEVAAWIAHDADRPAVSRDIAAGALTLSREAGDRDMEHFLVAHLGMLDIKQGRPASAVRMSSAVLEGRLSPRAEAVFLLRRGRGLVCLGAARDGLADLARARSLARSGSCARDPAWTFWVDESEVAWQEGAALAGLGQWRAAVPRLQAAAATRAAAGHGKNAVHYDQVCLLEALIRAGAWADARPVLTVVAEGETLIASARAAAVLRRTAARTGTAPPDVAATVRALAA